MRKSSKVLWIIVAIINLSLTSCTSTSLAADDEFEVVSTEGDAAKKKAKPDDD